MKALCPLVLVVAVGGLVHASDESVESTAEGHSLNRRKLRTSVQSISDAEQRHRKLKFLGIFHDDHGIDFSHHDDDDDYTPVESKKSNGKGGKGSKGGSARDYGSYAESKKSRSMKGDDDETDDDRHWPNHGFGHRN